MSEKYIHQYDSMNKIITGCTLHMNEQFEDIKGVKRNADP